MTQSPPMRRISKQAKRLYTHITGYESYTKGLVVRMMSVESYWKQLKSLEKTKNCDRDLKNLKSCSTSKAFGGVRLKSKDIELIFFHLHKKIHTHILKMVKNIPTPTQQVSIMSFVWASKFSGSHGTSPNDVTFALNSSFTSQISLQRNHQDSY